MPSSTSERAHPPRAIYVSHNPVASPLSRSQVLPYLRGLAAFGIETWLVTYERDGPRFPDGEFPRDRWVGLRARPGSHLLAKAMDVARGVIAVVRLARRSRADLIHARSYVPAAIAALAARLLARPYLFDMRGFLGEEYVEGGHWTPRDVRYRVLRLTERWLLRDAAAVVVLTHVGADRLRREARYAQWVRGKEIRVVPCVVDLDRFRPSPVRAARPTLVYSGSLGMWYLIDEMLQVYRAAREFEPSLRFLILNRDEHMLVRETLARRGLSEGDVELRAAEFDEMPQLLASSHVGIALLRQVSSKLGSSAVKVAEYLASGLPVVVNVGHGDIGELVRRHGAGHVMTSYGEVEVRAAGRAVVELLNDASARVRARRLAESHYDLRSGVEGYASIYARLSRTTSGVV